MSLSPAFQRIQQLFADEQCVLLDGGVGTELRRAGIKNRPLSDTNCGGPERCTTLQTPYWRSIAATSKHSAM